MPPRSSAVPSATAETAPTAVTAAAWSPGPELYDYVVAKDIRAIADEVEKG